MATIYICDKCKKRLTKETVVKKPLANNFSILTPGCKVWKQDGKQMALFCPHCDTAHFFGFNKLVKKEKQNEI